MAIPLKQGFCEVDGCGYFGPLVAKKCKTHYWANRSSIKKNNSTEELKTAKNKTKSKTFIRPVSERRKEALKKYRRARDKYFEENPVCEFPGCSSRKIDLHHKRGREGAFLTDKRYFSSLCRKHHDYIHNNPEEARKLGFIQSRLSKND